MEQKEFYEVNGCTDFIPVKFIGEHEYMTNTLNVELTETGNKTFVPTIYKFRKPPEPEKVVVPKLVAEWIEECKASRRSLRDSMKGVSTPVNAWLLRIGREMYPYLNQETFARAWLDGYEIEQEKLYTVEIPNPNKIGNDVNVLMMNGFKQIVIKKEFGDGWKNEKGFQLTESEIKQDFEWAWDAGFANQIGKYT